MICNSLITSNLYASLLRFICWSGCCKWLQPLQVYLKRLISWKYKTCKFCSVKSSSIIFGFLCTLQQYLSFIERNSNSYFTGLFVDVMSIYITLSTSITILKDFISIRSWSISPSKGFTCIFYSIQINLILKSICDLFNIMRFDHLEQFLFDAWLYSCLTSFVTIIHGFKLSLSCNESQFGSIPVRISSKYFVSPFQIFKLCILWSAHENRCFTWLCLC